MTTSNWSYRTDRRLDFRLSLIVAAVALVLGLIGVFAVLFGGSHGNLTSYVPWGLWVGVYVYLVWMEVGMILAYFTLRHVLRVEGIERLTPVVLLAALSALIGALAIIGLDLGHPFRAWRAFLTPNFGSLMTWMIWLHTIYLVILAVEIVAYRTGRDHLLKWLSIVSIPAGVILIAIIGGLFGVIAARPFWNASVLPLAFFISSLVAGTGLLTLLHLLFSPTAGTPAFEETAHTLGRYFLWAIVGGLIAAVANLLVIAYPNVPAHAEGLRLALFGPYWWTLWLVHIGIGTAIPLALLVLRPHSLKAIGVAAFLMVITFVMVPLNIVIPGLAYAPPDLAGLAAAYQTERLSFNYVPSLTEWLVVLFAAGLALAIFTIGYKFLLEDYFHSVARGEEAPPLRLRVPRLRRPAPASSVVNVKEHNHE